jgi:hypothetical protein
MSSLRRATIIMGPDGQAWASRQSLNSFPLRQISRVEAGQAADAPSIDAADHPHQYVPGTNRTLWHSQVSEDGSAKWVKFQHAADTTRAFKLPAPAPREASLDPGSIDDSGHALSLFRGSYAMYRKRKAIDVYWNGDSFYLKSGRRLNVPIDFGQHLPRAMGFEGTIFIPDEDDVDDLLISEEKQDRGRPDPYHEPGPPLTGRAAGAGRGGGWRADVAEKYHPVTGRQVAGLSPADTHTEAWNCAIFEIVDIYTEVGRVFSERLLTMEATVRPLLSPYRQYRIIPVELITSQRKAQDMYESIPAGVDLLFIDPNTEYVNATRERVDRPRHNADKQTERGSIVLGHNLDGSGQLQSLIVSGRDSSQSMINVGEGTLWVTDPALASESQYKAALKARIMRIKSSGAPGDDWQAAVAAFSRDATAHAASDTACLADVNNARANWLQEYTLNGGAMPGLHDLTAAAGSGEERGRLALRAAMDVAVPITGHGAGPARNLLGWQAHQRNNYATAFPRGALVNYTVGRDGIHTMAKVAIV